MLYIFDKDNTLIGGMGNRPPNTPNEQHPLPSVIKKLAELRSQGHILAIASNQGGVAWGFITEKEAQALIKDAAQKVGGVDFWRCCCYDPRAANRNPDNRYARKNYRRKPKPGMLKELIRAAGVSTTDTVMVGDAESDRQAAAAAGCTFVLASEFFGG